MMRLMGSRSRTERIWIWMRSREPCLLKLEVGAAEGRTRFGVFGWVHV